jgi:hypothetical protein
MISVGIAMLKALGVTDLAEASLLIVTIVFGYLAQKNRINIGLIL